MNDRLEEAEIVARALDGDVDAQRTIVRTHQAVALRTAYVITGSVEDAEEVVQDAFVKAFGVLSRFRRDRPLRPWLLTIVGNEARNRRRANASRPPLLAAADGDHAAELAPTPDVAALAAAERRALTAALHRLPEHDRQVLACRYFLDLGEREIAAVLGIRSGTVKSRISRALARLRATIDADV